MKKIPLTKGYFALVSDEDYERVSAFKWTASIESRGTKVYAIRWSRKSEQGDGPRRKIRLSHFILDVPPGSLHPDLVVDHKNEDSLDNQRGNLQVITQRENMIKSPGWKRAPSEPFL